MRASATKRPHYGARSAQQHYITNTTALLTANMASASSMQVPPPAA